MKSLLTTALTLLLGLISTYGQEYNHMPQFINPSPQAASLGVYGNINTSLSSGAASVSVPLFSLKEQSLNLDISVAYNYSGFRPSDPGGILGLGWNLLAGGVITRNINGMPDEQASGFKNTGHLFSASNPTNQLAQDIVHGTYDGAPDLFTFNFMGYSGSFYFGNDGQIYLKEQKPFKIFYESSGANPPGYPFNIPNKNLIRFIIKTDDGVTYIFRDVELSRVVVSGAAPGTDHPNHNQITAWYLSKVIGRNGEVITFNYIRQGGDNTNISESISEKWVNNVGNSDTPVRFVQNKTFEVHLSKIEGSLWTVDFEYTSNLIAPPSGTGYRYFRSLNRVILKDKISEQKRFEFTYSNATYRHLLKSITEKSGTQAAKPYLFDYHDESSLYPKSIRSIDKWGYYNGKPNPTSLIEDKLANRNPDFTYARTFALNKITYPTGGTSSISYASNTYSYLNGNAYVENVEQTQVYLYQWYYNGSSWEVVSNPGFSLTQPTQAQINVSYLPMPDPKPHQCMQVQKNVELQAGSYDINSSEFPSSACRDKIWNGTPRIDFTVTVKRQISHGYGSTPLIAGGIRVSQITNNPIDSPEEIITYNINNFTGSTNSSGSILNRYYTGFHFTMDNVPGKYFSSEPLNLMAQAPVIYNNVTESRNNQIYKRHYFSAFGGNTPGGINHYGVRIGGLEFDVDAAELFGPADDFSFMRGLPLKAIHFNSSSGAKTSVEKSQYVAQYDLETSPTAHKTYAYHSEILWWEKPFGMPVPIYVLKKYNLSSVWPRILHRTDSTFTHTGDFMAALPQSTSMVIRRTNRSPRPKPRSVTEATGRSFINTRMITPEPFTGCTRP